MKKIILVIVYILFVLIIVAISIFILWQSMLQPINQQIEDAHNYELSVPSGASIKTVARDLKENGIIRSADVLYYKARLGNISIKAGRYNVHSAQSVDDLLLMLHEGRQAFLRITIPEGLSITKIATLLEAEHIVSASDFIEACRDPVLLSEYDIPSNSGEGYLFPDTYFLNYGMNARDVVRLFYTNFFQKIEDTAPELLEDSAKLFNTIILASIIEREYRVASEAPLMASVFLNRLKYNIGLESCATLVYIITEIEQKPHPSIIMLNDLKIDNPYNTYKWAGLPPGPISNPGMTALNAALYPAQTDYYYFRLTDEVQGTHYFSKTLSEHAGVGRKLSIKK